MADHRLERGFATSVPHYSEIIMDTKRLQELAGMPLNESISDDYEELMAHLNNMKHFGQSFKSIKEEFAVNEGDTFKVLAEKIIKTVNKIQGQL